MSEADGALGVKQPSLIFAYVDSHKLLVKERENKIGLHNCPERARGNSPNREWLEAHGRARLQLINIELVNIAFQR